MSEELGFDDRDDQARYYEGLRDGNELLRNEVAATFQRVLELEQENIGLRSRLSDVTEAHHIWFDRSLEQGKRIKELESQIAETTNTSNRIALQNAHLRERIKALEAWIESSGIGVVVPRE